MLRCVLGIIWYARYISWIRRITDNNAYNRESVRTEPVRTEIRTEIRTEVRTEPVGTEPIRTEPVLIGPRSVDHVQCLTKDSCFNWM